MKKVLKPILSVVCFSAIILAGAENADGSCNLGWTLCCLAVAALSGYGLNRIMNK
jgi:hypothetical protein